VVNNGNEAYTWNGTKTVPVREYDFTETEVRQLEKAVTTCPRFNPGPMRKWLEPLLAQLPEPAESNGAGPPMRGTV